MNTTKLTEKENLTTDACYLATDRPADKKKQVKMYKNYRFRSVLRTWIRIIFPIPDPIPSGSGSGSYSDGHNNNKKITEKENLTTHACYLAPGGPAGKENQVKMYKK
jgi:hypothetical protein